MTWLILTVALLVGLAASVFNPSTDTAVWLGALVALVVPFTWAWLASRR